MHSFFNELMRISIKLSLKFVAKRPFNNKPAWRQAIIWTNDDLIYWRKYRSLGPSELIQDAWKSKTLRNLIFMNFLWILKLMLFCLVYIFLNSVCNSWQLIYRSPNPADIFLLVHLQRNKTETWIKTAILFHENASKYASATWKLTTNLFRHWCVNSSPPSAAYMRRWTGSSLFQVMAWRLFGAKPLYETMLVYYQSDFWEQF